MSRTFSRLACLVFLSGLTAFAGTAAEAANIGVNLTVRTQNAPQTVYAGVRNSHVGYGIGSAAPGPSYGGVGYQHRGTHVYDPNHQFDGMGDSSANTKLK